jgi:hypothetical protein
MAAIGQHARGLPGLPEAHGKIPVWNSEDWYFEDFTVGDVIRSIRRTISEGESMLFNSLVMDHHPYVSDERFAAEEGVFGKRLVAGAMVFSYGLGLAATNCLNSFSYGYDRLRFIASRCSSATRSTQSARTWRRRSIIMRWAKSGSAIPSTKGKANRFFTASTL